MPTIKKILVPIDFSARSERAAGYARGMAEHFGASIALLHVLPQLNLEFSMIPPNPERMEELTHHRRQRIEAELSAFGERVLGGVPVQSAVVEGGPADEIVKFCHTQHVDTVVLSTQGCGPLRRFLIGSVAAKVLHDAHCPIWTGTHLEHEANFPDFRLRHIICALDFGAQTDQVLNWGAKLARHFSASVTLLHAASDAGSRPSAEERLGQLAASHNLTPDLIVEPGEPHHVAAAAARQRGADLLIIGRGTAEGPLKGLRANAYAIVRQSPVPVLSV